MTDHPVRILMAVDHRAGDFPDRVLSLVKQSGGTVLGRSDGALISMFPDVTAATACAEALQSLEAWQERIAVSLGAVVRSAPPLLGEGIDGAMTLLRSTARGEISISMIPDKPPVYRMREPTAGESEPATTGSPWLAALQWGGLLGYFAIWMGLIVWKMIYYAEYGSWPCWPDFLCG